MSELKIVKNMCLLLVFHMHSVQFSQSSVSDSLQPHGL